MPPTLFAFLDPFSGSLWVSIALAYVLVSITLFVVSRCSLYLHIHNIYNTLAVSRFSPIEWENEDPCDEAAGVDELTQELFIIVSHCV